MIRVSFETALIPPYGGPKHPYGTLVGAVTGPASLADLFETAIKRAKRRGRERQRATEHRRPRPRTVPGPLTAADPVPRGFHLRGTCPDCKED
jgi:hypothetical protein